jgi:hypothetical protein
LIRLLKSMSLRDGGARRSGASPPGGVTGGGGLQPGARVCRYQSGDDSPRSLIRPRLGRVPVRRGSSDLERQPKVETRRAALAAAFTAASEPRSVASTVASVAALGRLSCGRFISIVACAVAVVAIAARPTGLRHFTV